jgi:hypothetical protein
MSIVSILLIASLLLSGCSATSQRASTDPPSFDKGLDALHAHNFEQASFYFSELAKDGDPAAMNNLGVALMMVDRKEEAIFWFRKATQYGDKNAPKALAEMGEEIPQADLVQQHPNDLKEKQSAALGALVGDIIVGALIGVALGVSLKYGSNSNGYYTPVYNPWTNNTDTNSLSVTNSNSTDCSSDFSCGIGERCVKAPYQSTGVCMKTVNNLGLQEYDSPNTDSIGVKTDEECFLDTDCPVGFKCHNTYKVCVKS